MKYRLLICSHCVCLGMLSLGLFFQRGHVIYWFTIIEFLLFLITLFTSPFSHVFQQRLDLLKKVRLVLLFLIAISLGVIYQAFFTPSHLVSGDAPYFYPTALSQLFNPPLLWDSRGNNFGMDQSMVLWLYIPTFLYGFLNYIFPFLTNDWLIRMIFYFPGILLAITGSYALIKSRGHYQVAALVGSFLYSFNTYYLMIIDGGQIGVVLAYGLFPWVVFGMAEWIRNGRWARYIGALVGLLAITNVDIRLAVLVVPLTAALYCRTRQNWLKMISLFPLVILVDLYWLIPFLTSHGEGSPALAFDFHGLQLTDSLLLFQPHFPLNQFGETQLPPFYFVGLLFLILIGYSSRLFLGVFLLLVFLAKGDSQPLGEGYRWMVTHLPFGAAFRDSSKFYVPLLLLSGVMTSQAVERLMTMNKRIIWLPVLGVFLYLNILIYPAWLHQLRGVLAVKETQDIIYEQLASKLVQSPAHRSLWFPEQPPLGFADWNHPALAATVLYQDRPFASMIDGNYDLFGFLNNSQFVSWLKVMNVGTVFFPENPRQKIWTEKQREERALFVPFVQTVFAKEQLISAPFPAFQLMNPSSRIFSTAKAVLVLGGEEIYRPWVVVQPEMRLDHEAVIFLQDSRVDLNQLELVASSDAVVAMVGKQSIDDLMMALHQDWLVKPERLTEVGWGKRLANQYLDWKSELLKGGIRNYDFPASSEVFFSSQSSERLEWAVPSGDGQYYLALRTSDASQSSNLVVSVNQQRRDISANEDGQLIWQIVGPWQLSAGSQKVVLENPAGFHAVNGMALISSDQLTLGRQQAQEWMNHFQVIALKQPEDWKKMLAQIQQPAQQLQFESMNPTQYKVADVRYPWLVFTDHFAPGWQIENASAIHAPGYAMVNTFYLPDTIQSRSFTISYKPRLWNFIF